MFETTCAIPVDRPKSAGFRACATLLSFSLFTTGCLFQKKPVARPFIPPPPQPSQTAAVKVPQVMAPPPLILEPADPASELAVVTGSGSEQFSPPPRPTPPARRPPPAKPAPQPAAVETPATPQLAQIFTPEQLRENNRTIDESLDRVDRALDALGKKSLNVQQKDRAGLIRELEIEARQMREKDLASAVSLAKRADQLAKDLLDHLP